MCFEDKKVDNFLYFIKSHNYILRDCCIDQSLPYEIVASINRYPMRLLHRSIVTLRDFCIDQSLPYEIVASFNRYPMRLLHRSIVIQSFVNFTNETIFNISLLLYLTSYDQHYYIFYSGIYLIKLSSTNKTDRHDITEILFKVALNTIILTLILIKLIRSKK
jgi:hypothetical protein